MNGNVIAPVCEEEFITDAMLEEFADFSSASFLASPPTPSAIAAARGSRGFSSAAQSPFANASLTPAKGALRSGDLSGLLESSGASVLLRSVHRGSIGGPPPLELASSELSSDDSGDFAFLTSGVRDADAYDLIRQYMVYSKQQEKDLAELEAECARLEAEQHHLYGAAVAADMTRRKSQGDATADPLAPDSLAATTASARPDVVVADLDEVGIDPRQACPYTNPNAASPRAPSYRYGPPGIRGRYTAVFKDGVLYRCTAADGAWIFYNDSQQFVMQVKYVLGASSVVRPGRSATVTQRASGEYEAQVMVWPRETEILLVGSVNGFKNLSVAVPVDASYVNPHTAESTVGARAMLQRFAAESGKSSPAMLTVEDVLECCDALVDSDAGTDAPEGAVHFVDPEFPPCGASLYRPAVDEVFLWDMPWALPADYLPPAQRDEACLFAGGVLPTDPFQGDGGDAYFCSAARILAERPSQVTRLFHHPVSVEAGREERAVGAYRVALAHGGWWKSAVVDRYLPASLRGPELGRCSHDLRKLWYPLLEKAYAKLHGSYAAIQCGDPLEALQDLTGFPAFRFDEEWAAVAQSGEGSGGSSGSEALFAFLEAKVHACGYLVCLSLPDDSPPEAPCMQLGMEYGMSYALLRLVRHGAHRLLQLRCPTLRPDGPGLWSPESARWQQEPQLAGLCGMEGPAVAQEPAALWLDWSEALSMFEGGGVCCARWDWAHDCRVRGTFDDGVPSLVLEVRVVATDEGEGPGPVDAYCTLSQEDDRGLAADHPNRVLQPLMLCVSTSCSGEAVGANAASGPEGSVAAEQHIGHVCSTDPDAPADQLNFILGRDTALRFRFEPSAHPYYVIPRSLGDMSKKLFTVGLVSSTPVTRTGKLRVRPVQLPADSPVFRNEHGFATDKLGTVAAASFQLRGPDGCVKVGCGSGIG